MSQGDNCILENQVQWGSLPHNKEDDADVIVKQMVEPFPACFNPFENALVNFDLKLYHNLLSMVSLK
jgi:hypothetical protein